MSVRIYLKTEAVTQIPGSRAYKCDEVPGFERSICSSHSGHYVSDSEQWSIFDGIPFRSLLPEDIVDRVSLFYTFPRDGSTNCASVIGIGTFHFGESIIIIKRNLEGGWNITIESPSVSKFNETISAIRSGEITQEGKDRTVLELLTDDLHHAKLCIKNVQALLEESYIEYLKSTRWYKTIGQFFGKLKKYFPPRRRSA